MSTQYKVTIANKSLANGKMCIYQKLPYQREELFSLAWFSKQCNINTKLTFKWDVEYCASWAETGVLKPDVPFRACETRDADPFNPSANAFGLSYIYGGYQFVDTLKQTDPGTIGIFPDGSIPNRTVSIGVGMNGEPAFATQALMNYNFVFIPKVRYYLVFGSYQQGVVMESDSTNAFEIVFPANVFEREIVLNEDGRFSYSR